LDGDDGKHMLLVVCLNPSEAYVSKNQKHLGFIVAGQLVPDPDAQVSANELRTINKAYIVMQTTLDSLYMETVIT
jgi:hypothetical protein